MSRRKLDQFAREYPDVVLEITTDDSPLDLVASRFDASIHLGEFIERDMIARRVQRAALVASPQYFESHPKRKSPRDLPKHRCIDICMGSAGIDRREFDKRPQSPVVGVNGQLVIDVMDMTIRAALDGIGPAFLLEEDVAPHLANGCTRARPGGVAQSVRWLLPITRAGDSSTLHSRR